MWGGAREYSLWLRGVKTLNSSSSVFRLSLRRKRLVSKTGVLLRSSGHLEPGLTRGTRLEGFILGVAAGVVTILLARRVESLLAWLRVRANDLLLVKLAKAVKQKYPTLGATNLEKKYVKSVKDMKRPIRYGFLGLRRSEAKDLPVKELVKVFQKAVKKNDRLVVLKIAIMSMGETKEYKAHYENIMDELREEASVWCIRDLTAKHVEMAAVFLMTKRGRYIPSRF